MLHSGRQSRILSLCTCRWQDTWIKGEIRPKNEISVNTCSPRCCWKVEWIFLVSQTFLEFYSKTVLHCSAGQLKQMGICFKTTQKSTKWLHKTQNTSSKSPGSPKIQDRFEKTSLAPVSKGFTVAAELKPLTYTPFEVGAHAWLNVEGINKVFSNQFVTSGLL